MAIAPKLQKVLTDLFVMLWDLGLAILNFILPKRKPGLVVPAGVPGHQGKWPKYIAPREGDSRSACPMLNAMVRPSSLLHLNPPRTYLTLYFAGQPWHPSS
jgi:hypothetical protein